MTNPAGNPPEHCRLMTLPGWVNMLTSPIKIANASGVSVEGYDKSINPHFRGPHLYDQLFQAGQEDSLKEQLDTITVR